LVSEIGHIVNGLAARDMSTHIGAATSRVAAPFTGREPRMLNTSQRLMRQRNARGNDGFTLIELLIVIVVLGILAAVVIFALGGITGKSAIAACQADGATVSTAIAALEAQYPGTTWTSGTASNLATTAHGGPYIQSWPNNSSHYTFAGTGTSTAGLTVQPAGGASLTYTGPSSCNSVT
jgi:prepilin-type N-terminal cleavage/methylation domain-containing protein